MTHAQLDIDENPTGIAVNFEHSPAFVDILAHLNASLVVSTYQAGKVLVLGVHDNQLKISYLDYDQPMGIAISQDKIAIGAGSSIHFMQSSHATAPSAPPRGSHDGCYVAHTSRHTGRILVHDLAWGDEGLWVVNTLFSCLCTLDNQHSFVPRWKPSFITQLADEDRCHLNGMAMENGVPKYVTVLAPSDTAAGWRADKAKTGALIDVSDGELIVRGLCMPHSPRIRNGELFVLNSGRGELTLVDRATGRLNAIERVPGYTRGLAFYGQFAFVGLSRIRETNVFGGLPIGERRDELCCGVAVIDMHTGRTVASFRFLSGVEEIFAVDIVPGFQNLAIGGASHDLQQNEIWIVPAEPPVHALGPSASAKPSLDFLKSDAAVAHEEGRLSDALELLTSALNKQPDSPELLCSLGNLYQDLSNPNAALACYEKSVQLQPKQSHVQRNLGVLYAAKNQPMRALHHFEMAQKAEPDPMNFLLGANVLPIIYESQTQLEYWRNRLTACVDNLVESGVKIDTTNSMIPTSFYLAYHGENDRALMEKLAKIYRGVQCCPAAIAGGWKPRNKKLRVGFVSAYFCQHTIGRLNLGVIQHLNRNEIEVTVIALASHRDSYTHAYREAADRFVEVPRQPAKARRAISELGLDVLIFADVGMDSLSQTLSYSRMAPIQAVTWGHPNTTGSPAIDYFLSSDLAEPNDAPNHYSEQLIRMPSMGVHYLRPQLIGQQRDKPHFGLNPNRRVYLCPQTLFKFHPDFDQALRRILELDPLGDLVVIQSSTPVWSDALKNRWKGVLPDSENRVRWLPGQPREEFLQLLTVADVVLDPFPFCGGNSSYEAFAVGAPVVTLPGNYLRGRLTYGMLKRMGLESLASSSIEQYVQRALNLAKDESAVNEYRRSILQANEILFDNQADVSDYETAIHQMVHV